MCRMPSFKALERKQALEHINQGHEMRFCTTKQFQHGEYISQILCN